MSKKPGIQRPVLDKSVHDTVSQAFRNVYDNLYDQQSQIDQKAAKPSDPAPAATPQSPTYMPILFNITNLDGSTPYPLQWAQAGKVVTVSGRVDVNPTAAGAAKLGISLPVKTNLQFEYQLGGVAACPTIAGEVAPMAGDTGNNRAQMSWVATNTSNYAMFFSFTYLVN